MMGNDLILRTMIHHPKYLWFLIILLFLAVGCREPLQPPGENQLPTTTIANTPASGDTLFALVTLQWDGGDEDGFIQGYEYKYTTEYLTSGETLETDWTFTNKTKVTLAFNSQDTLNKQSFKVRAIDNTGQVDSSPATKEFYTIRTVPPQTEIVEPGDNSEHFVVEDVTDWWRGIPLEFKGYDRDGDITEFAWAVDDGEWHWTGDTTTTSLYITPDEFSDPLTGEHIIRLTARDNTNIINENPDTVKIELVKATFSKEVLIIDETTEGEFPSSVSVTDSTVDAYYAELFGTDNSWEYDPFVKDPLPSREILGQYKTVVWHADSRPASEPHALSKHTDYLEDYMNVGGNFIMSGWRILKSFAWDRDFPVTFSDTSFVHEYLHITEADESPYYPGDFTGATATLSAEGNIRVDSTKLAGAFPYEGKLSNINIIVQPAGFTDVLYRYQNAPGSSLPAYNGRACALKYIGTSYNTVVLGFPLYFIQKEDAKSLASQVLQLIK